MSPLHPSGGAAAACSVTATVRQANPAESKTTGGNTGNTANSVMSRHAMRCPFADDLAGTSGVAEIAENKFYVAWSAPAMHAMPAPGRWVHAAARLRGREGWG